jgi:hypothetical protein
MRQDVTLRWRLLSVSSDAILLGSGTGIAGAIASSKAVVTGTCSCQWLYVDSFQIQILSFLLFR